ncbi:MAG: SusC/RagA family TonB-linked outer membrane protein, partial [Bacteroidota bacterium]
EFIFSGLSGSGEDLPTGVTSLGAAANNQLVNSNRIETSLRSVFGRATYSYDNKYLLTANFRRDESSKLFRSSNPSGDFPSFSAGWRINNENFMADMAAVSELKLRGGWGRLGNQTPLNAFPTDVLLRTDFFYVINGQAVQGISQSDLANPDITWEVTEQWDVGLDLGLWDDRLLFTTDYYNRETEDLIIRAAVPPSAGLGAPFVNIGRIRNSGLEFALTYRNYDNDFKYNISANLTTINNEVLELSGEDVEIFSGGAVDDLSGTNITRVGDPIGSFYGFVSDGIFQSWDEVYSHARINQATGPDGSFNTTARDAETAISHTAPGDVKWRDVNGDGVVNQDDRQVLGSPIPDFIYGFTLNLEYKGFDLQAFLQGAHGHQVFNVATRWLEDFRQNFNQGTAALDRWTEANPSTTTPRATRSDPNQNILRVSDRYIEDASFLKFRNLTVGYTFGRNVLQTLNASRFRVYATVQNLAVITGYSGLEPEIGSNSSGTALDAGVDRLIYPQSRNFLVGVQLGF